MDIKKLIETVDNLSTKKIKLTESVNLNGKEVDISSLEVDGVDTKDTPDFADAYFSAGEFADGTKMSDDELEALQNQNPGLLYDKIHEFLHEGRSTELHYESKKPSLKSIFNQLSEDATGGMKPFPVIDPTNKQAGTAVLKSPNKQVTDMLKGLNPRDLQVVMTTSAGATSTKPATSTGTATPSAGATQVREEQLDEKAPPGMEKWIKDRKAAFKKQYGDRWEEVLYATAWKEHDKKGVEESEEEQLDELTGIKDPEKRKEYIDAAEKDKNAAHNTGNVLRALGAPDKIWGPERNKEYHSSLAAHQRRYDNRSTGIDRARANPSMANEEAELNETHKVGDLVSYFHHGLGDHLYGIVKTVGDDHITMKTGTQTRMVPMHLVHKADKNKVPKYRYMEEVEQIDEKWGTETKVAPSEKGKYKGKTKAELLKRYNKLKKSGPHKKGSKEYGTMRELAFAIRAKSKWGKVKEAERPSDQVDMGAGLGAGRSQTVLESSMKNTCKAAYHEGKAHGLGGHGYHCSHDVGTDEHRHYHEGFKHGLDECYGIDPMRGVVDEGVLGTLGGAALGGMLGGPVGAAVGAVGGQELSKGGSSVFDETAPATVKGMADQEMDMDECSMEEGLGGAIAGGIAGGYLGKSPSAAMTGAQIGSAIQDKLTTDEGNAFTGMLAKTKKGGKFSLGGHTYTDTSDLDEMLDTKEIRVTKTDPMGKTSVTRFDYPSDLGEMAFESLERQLNALLNEDAVQEGISVSISKGNQSGSDSVSVTATDHDADNLLALVKNAGMGVFSADKETSDYGAPVSKDGHAEVEDHDSVLSLMKKMAGIESSGDYESEDSDEGCGCGQSPCGCSHLDETESEDQMEFEVAEDQTETEMTDADEEAEAQTDLAVAQADSAEEEDLTEWANDAGKMGTEEAFTTGDEFMLDTISSGLNKKKSTGQTTIPVIAGQKDRMGYNESISDWKKLAGLK